MLLKVTSKDTATIVAALGKHVRKLPQELRRSLTWDRGKEMADHKSFTIATDVQVYFCDPRSAWQRGSRPCLGLETGAGRPIWRGSKTDLATVTAFFGEIGEILVDEIIPDGFLRLSDAVDRLARGIWGGLRRPAPVRAAKREDKRARIGFGPWKQEAGKQLRRAAIDGKLAIYAFAEPLTAANNQSQMPVAVSPTVLGRLIASRETLPDHPFRPTLKTTAGDQKTLELLQNGILLAAEQEFNHWYHSERAKRRWASQQSTLKRKEGRPSKQTQALKNAVINAMHKQKTSIVELHRRLLASGRTDVPSPIPLDG
jgi:hypothetical protein